MSVKITFHGHSAFSLSDGTHTVLMDPFITGESSGGGGWDHR